MIQIEYNVNELKWKNSFPEYKNYISKSVNETLKIINRSLPSNATVSFFLTSNKNIKELNRKFRKRNKVTNVLSFPMQSYYENSYFLGDIALSGQTLLQEANEQKIYKYDYLCKMTIHGMLHLLGYDHITDKQFHKMNKIEDLIFKIVKQD